MNLNVIIDWKFIVAVGASTVGIIFAVKMDSESAETAVNHMVDAGKDYAIAISGDC